MLFCVIPVLQRPRKIHIHAPKITVIVRATQKRESKQVIISVREFGQIGLADWQREVFTAVLPRRAGFARGRCSTAGLSTRGLGAQPLALPTTSQTKTSLIGSRVQFNIILDRLLLNFNKNSPNLIFTVSNVDIPTVVRLSSVLGF